MDTRTNFLTKRFLAFFIDTICAYIFSTFPYFGPLIAASYMLFRDGFEWDFMRYRSLGKTAMKLKVVMLEGERKLPDMATSMRRNWILAAPYLVALIPVLGVILNFFVVPAVSIYEGVKLLKDPAGRRKGDHLANTSVIEDNQQDETD